MTRTRLYRPREAERRMTRKRLYHPREVSAA